MKAFKDYINYFKYLTEQHPELLHSDDVGSRVFQLIEVEEAFGDFKTGAKEKGIVFRLFQPYWNLADAGGDARVTIQGGFQIAKYHSSRKAGTTAHIEAIDACGKIAQDIAEKMIADSKNQHPLFYHSIRSVQHLNWVAQPQSFVGDGTYSGFICTFTFDNWMRNCIDAHDNEDWKASTPHTFD